MAYVVWSVVCLILHMYPVQASRCGETSFDISPIAWRPLVLAGGPPLLLWADAPVAWPVYAFLSLVVVVLGGGGVMTWRENVALSGLLWACTLLAWLSAALVLFIAAV